jgi:arginyl-tRNA synthetase
VSEVVGTLGLVEGVVAAAMGRVLPQPLAAADPIVRRSEHADFQSNVALDLAKRAQRAPRELAVAILGALEGEAVSAELSGPGFLNLTVSDAVLWSQVSARLADERLGVGAPLAGVRTVVDYSAPNIAKEMHVGHLRTTVIGDALARILGYLGSDVVRANHLGDWGTQFGMLIQYLDEHPEADWHHAGGRGVGDATATATANVSVLDALYKRARARFQADQAFADRSRARVVALQAGDAATLAVWRDLVEVSTAAFQVIYDRLGVLMRPEDAAPESFYNPMLDAVVAELGGKGLLTESDGALCVFFDDIVGPDGQPVPLIVRKADGGYGYAATDLATVRYRILELKAGRLLYVIDARQALHMRMVYETARRAGWLTDAVEAVHVAFGTVLGPDGRPFKTRDGDTVRLIELLDAAVDTARAVIEEKAPALGPAELERVVAAAGIGAVKYADLSTSRTKDYVFDLQRMVSLQGNTAVYMQYAHARVCSLLAKLPAGVGNQPVDVTLPLHPAERALALRLDEFEQVLAEIARLLEPHRLCTYLFEVAQAFSGFFESCPILKAESEAQRANRVALARLTGATLARGLDLLGLQAPARM